MRQSTSSPINFLLNLPVGQTRIKKFIPENIFKTLKVYKYHLWLLTAVMAGNSGSFISKWIKFFRTDRKRILFFPDIPWDLSMIYQICLLNGYEITNNLSGDFDLAIKWKDATFYQPEPSLRQLTESRPVININCNDISKAHVDAVFGEVFGYRLTVDPRTFTGKCVQKSNFNASHDGRIVDCPIEDPEDGAIYQMIVDNRVSDDRVLDMRVPAYKGEIPFVALWWKPIEHRFTPDVDEDRLAEPSQVFTEEELKKIKSFCEKMGLDYGELDILRNKDDGRLYIIDVNNTPCGMTREKEDLKRQALSFANTFLGSV